MEEFDELRRLVDLLHARGAGDYVSLPQIAVMGDTSSGKSSVLSMITRVVLPSSADLTTRCATQLHMSRGDVMAATIRILWHSTSAYKVHEDDDDGFKERKVTDFAEITAAIADAQAFIIECSGKEVARDVIEVTVRSPDSVNLTLIDLPGIVRTHGKGESASLGDDILALMQDYLKNPRCIVLAVIPANVDFHNSQIMSDALKVDPDTTRTIPIITKPDLIDKGSEGSVLDLLLGKKTQEFKLGFHIVKGRGQAALDRGDTVEKGLSDEEVYFRNTVPWSTVDAELKGVHALRTKLASIQVRMLESEVPSIKAEIAAKRSAAEEKHASLGDCFPSINQKRNAFTKIVESVHRISSQAVTGKGGDSGQAEFRNEEGYTLRSSTGKLVKDFGKRVLVTRLCTFSTIAEGDSVIAYIGGSRYKGKVYKKMNDGTVAVDPVSSKDESVFLENDAPNYHVTARGAVGSKVQLTGAAEGSYAILSTPTSSPTYWVYKSYSCDKLTNDNSAWLLEQIEKNETEDLCIFPSAEIFNSIVRNAVEADWKPIALGLLDRVAQSVRACVIFALNASLKAYQNVAKRMQGFLTDRLLDGIVRTTLEHCYSEILDCIDKEKQPSTQNHYLMENVKRERNANLIKLIDSGATLDMVKAHLLRSEKKSNDEFVAGELQIALSAYGKVAAKRFIDNVEISINKALAKIAPLVGKLYFEVRDEELEKLMSEPSDTAEKRKRLEREIKAMQDAEEAIKALL